MAMGINYPRYTMPKRKEPANASSQNPRVAPRLARIENSLNRVEQQLRAIRLDQSIRWKMHRLGIKK